MDLQERKGTYIIVNQCAQRTTTARVHSWPLEKHNTVAIRSGHLVRVEANLSMGGSLWTMVCVSQSGCMNKNAGCIPNLSDTLLRHWFGQLCSAWLWKSALKKKTIRTAIRRVPNKNASTPKLQCNTTPLKYRAKT